MWLTYQPCNNSTVNVFEFETGQLKHCVTHVWDLRVLEMLCYVFVSHMFETYVCWRCCVLCLCCSCVEWVLCCWLRDGATSDACCCKTGSATFMSTSPAPPCVVTPPYWSPDVTLPPPRLLVSSGNGLKIEGWHCEFLRYHKYPWILAEFVTLQTDSTDWHWLGHRYKCQPNTATDAQL